MRVKVFRFLILLLFVSMNMFSQARIGTFGHGLNRFNKINKKKLEEFKSKKVKFVLPNYFSRKEYESILESTWKISPYEIVSNEDFDKYELKIGDCLAEFKHVKIWRNRGGFKTPFEYIVIDFVIVKKTRSITKRNKDRIKSSYRLATIYLTAPIDKIKSNVYLVRTKNIEPKSIEDMVTFRLGFLKNYFQFVNDNLEKGISFNIFEKYANEKELKKLKTSILYTFNNFRNKPDLSKYLYEKEQINFNDLEKNILGEKPKTFYYVMATRVNNKEVLAITNGKTGEVIYQDYRVGSVNNSKFFKKLSSHMKNIK